MAKDIFSGLSDLMNGLYGFMPQDDPNISLMNAQSELGDLEQKEQSLLAEIGRQAYAANPDAYPQAEKLKLVQMNIAEAEQRADAASRERQAAERAKREQSEAACL